MLNLYEPMAEKKLENRTAGAGSRGSGVRQDGVCPSTEEHVLFLVENVYEVGCDVGSIVHSNLPKAVNMVFRGR